MTRFAGRLSVAVAGLAIVVLVAQIAEAQGRGGGRRGGRGFGRGGQNTVSLAANEQVQEVITFTDPQKTKITEISEKLAEDQQAAFPENGFGGGGGDFDPEAFAEYQTKVADLVAKAEAALTEAVDATQNVKLLSVLAQLRGGASLTDAAMATHLKVTPEQKTELAEVVAANTGRRGGGRGFGGGGRRGRGGLTAEEQAELDKQYTDVLTADQQAEFAKVKEAQELTDEQLQQLRGRRGGGGRGRGGRGGGGGGAGAGGAGGAGDGGGF